MDLTTITAPTPEEIDATIRQAQKARAIYLRNVVQSAAQWLTHPHLGHRTA